MPPCPPQFHFLIGKLVPMEGWGAGGLHFDSSCPVRSATMSVILSSSLSPGAGVPSTRSLHRNRTGGLCRTVTFAGRRISWKSQVLGAGPALPPQLSSVLWLSSVR